MINRRIWLATCLAATCGFTASALAQDTQSSQMQANKSITVTGCLQRDTQSAVGTSGSTAATTSGAAAEFKLTSVTSGSDAATTTAGTSGSTSAQPAASEYKLEGDSSTLSPHVGEKVEITGTVQDNGSASSTASSASSTSSASSAANASPKLRVDHVKMIAASCQ